MERALNSIPTIGFRAMAPDLCSACVSDINALANSSNGAEDPCSKNWLWWVTACQSFQAAFPGQQKQKTINIPDEIPLLPRKQLPEVPVFTIDEKKDTKAAKHDMADHAKDDKADQAKDDKADEAKDQNKKEKKDKGDKDDTSDKAKDDKSGKKVKKDKDVKHAKADKAKEKNKKSDKKDKD